MARVSEQELERMKAEISLERLAEAKGVKLKKHGENLLGLCPFHEDREPSLVITPSKNLWHCLGACQTGGTVIDWVMRAEGVRFRHAVELLREGLPSLDAFPEKPRGRQQGKVAKQTTTPKLPVLFERSTDDEVLLRQVVDYYHETLKASPEALGYLEKRGLRSSEMIERFRLGFANRTLAYRLPQKNRKTGAELRGRLQALGILRESGHEHLNGSLVIPVFDEQSRVTEMYGRKINDDLRTGTPKHLYLPGPHRGVWNEEALASSKEIILCESLIDALTFWCAGYRSVTASYGVEGFTEDHREAFRRHGIERVLIAYDRDEAGDRAANKLAAELGSEGIESLRVLFPKGMDANEYALKLGPAEKSLGLVLRNAEWLSGGQAKAQRETASSEATGNVERDAAKKEKSVASGGATSVPDAAGTPETAKGTEAQAGASALDEPQREVESLAVPADAEPSWRKLAVSESGPGEAGPGSDDRAAVETEAIVAEAARTEGVAQRADKEAEQAAMAMKVPALEAVGAEAEEIFRLAAVPSEPEQASTAAGRQVGAEARVAPASVAEGDARAVPARAPAAERETSPAPARASASKQATEDVVIELGDRRWRIRGLGNKPVAGQLRVNLLVSRGEAFHVDGLELYSARQRAAYTSQAAVELGVEERVIKRDLGHVLLKLEERVDERQRAAEAQEKRPEMGDKETAEALGLLRSPRLIERILEDFEQSGVVGEETNKLVGYLAATSRKLEDPLAIVIQSASAAGKSSLMEAVLSLMPDEERVQYSAMTGQSLFYMGEQDLKHKILAIVEEEGAERAAYALKLLQSEGELTIASTGKDPQTGRLVTQEYRVEGPVMIFLTTTAIEVDEELLNRCIVLSVDEGREQTRAIHERQRWGQTLEGLLERQDRQRVRRLHQNAQRLLKPLLVANPFARELTFVDHQTRMRRDHMKYLTLIRTIALLHQYQRPIQQVEHRGETVRYIEVTREDVELANRLCHEVLGTSLDELPPQTRRLLELLDGLVTGETTRLGIERGDYRFTRRQVREHTGWGDTQLKVHLGRLVELELVLVHRGQHSQRYVYELVGLAEGRAGAPQLMGLADPRQLGLYDENRSGSAANRSGPKGNRSGAGRPLVGGWSGVGRPGEGASNERQNGSNGDRGPRKLQNSHLGRRNGSRALAVVAQSDGGAPSDATSGSAVTVSRGIAGSSRATGTAGSSLLAAELRVAAPRA
jgi:DNA primase catalytic core